MKSFGRNDTIRDLLWEMAKRGEKLGPEGGPFELTFKLDNHVFKLRVEMLSIDGVSPVRGKPHQL